MSWVVRDPVARTTVDDGHAQGRLVGDHLGLARTLDSSGYFDPDDQPASITP